MAFNYNTTLCTNSNFTQGLSGCQAKGYKLVITHFLGLLGKCNYSDSASYCICLQPLEVGYNYYMSRVWCRSADIALCGGAYIGVVRPPMMSDEFIHTQVTAQKQPPTHDIQVDKNTVTTSGRSHQCYETNISLFPLWVNTPGR